ncbi:hypothetical protein U1Q18_044836 [Sarracenia purpurea var. burkii]
MEIHTKGASRATQWTAALALIRASIFWPQADCRGQRRLHFERGLHTYVIHQHRAAVAVNGVRHDIVRFAARVCRNVVVLTPEELRDWSCSCFDCERLTRKHHRRC